MKYFDFYISKIACLFDSIWYCYNKIIFFDIFYYFKCTTSISFIYVGYLDINFITFQSSRECTIKYSDHDISESKCLFYLLSYRKKTHIYWSIPLFLLTPSIISISVWVFEASFITLLVKINLNNELSTVSLRSKTSTNFLKFTFKFLQQTHIYQSNILFSIECLKNFTSVVFFRNHFIIFDQDNFE